MEYYTILLPLALILLLSKSLGIFSKKIGIPQVIGMLLAGILIGLIKLIPNQTVLSPSVLEGLSFIAKIGVVLIMFSAGLETNIKQIKATGAASVVITMFGVILPIGLGFIVATLFNGGFSNMSHEKLLSNLFYGVILTATSVSVT
ncbi:cation:proton antiporter, partial [bacterium]|nr:cation:proton antiporter [bacterium]